MGICYMFRQYFAPKGSDKICMKLVRLGCNRAIESSYWRTDNNLDVGLLTGYVLTGYRLNLDPWIWILFPMIRIAHLLCSQVDRQDTVTLSIA